MNQKGVVWINREFKETKVWPGPDHTFKNGTIDLEAEYKKALAGKLVPVYDICVNDSGYLVFGESPVVGGFLWTIEKSDTKGFLPIINKNGVIMPAGMTIIQELEWMAKHHCEILKNQYHK